ncbi:hypothetical protein FOZ62_027112, partial [Perkinsus olseni]
TRHVRSTLSEYGPVIFKSSRFVYGQYLTALKKEREAEQARASENERVPDESPQPREEDDAMEAGRASENVRPRRKHSRSVGLHFASSVSDM